MEACNKYLKMHINKQTFQMTCSHLPQAVHESLNVVEESMLTLTFFGHQHFSDSSEVVANLENINKKKVKNPQSRSHMSGT